MVGVAKKKPKACKKKRQVIEKDGKFYTTRGTELTRASNTLSEAEFWAKILSALRRVTMFWKPANDKLEEGKRINQSSNKRLKFEYHCQGCDEWFPKSKIQIDHIINCGGINSAEKVKGWIEKAFVEKGGFQRLCLTCHNSKSLAERRNKGDK